MEALSNKNFWYIPFPMIVSLTRILFYDLLIQTFIISPLNGINFDYENTTKPGVYSRIRIVYVSRFLLPNLQKIAYLLSGFTYLFYTLEPLIPLNNITSNRNKTTTICQSVGNTHLVAIFKFSWLDLYDKLGRWRALNNKRRFWAIHVITSR